MTFPTDFRERVKDACDILEVIGQYVALKKSGVNYVGLCPFHHEKTPSFNVNPAKRIFHCFGCGVGGDVIAFIMQREKMSYPEALEFLAQRAGLEIPSYDSKAVSDREKLFAAVMKAQHFFRQQFKQDPVPARYLHQRGFSRELAEKMELGYAPDKWDGFCSALKTGFRDMVTVGLLRERKSEGYYDYFRHRLMFPIKNQMGRVCAFGGRYLGVEDKENAKYLNSPENPIYSKGSLLYGIHHTNTAIRKAGFAYLVEGYTDFLRLLTSGIENCAANLGTALTVKQGRILRRFADKVLVLYDGDEAGTAAAVKSARVLLKMGLEVEITALPEEHDPDSFLVEFGKEGLLAAPQMTVFQFQLRRAGGLPGTRMERAKLAAEMLESAAALPAEAERSLAVQEIAELLNIPPESLAKDLSNIMRKRPVEREEEEETVLQLQFAPAEIPERDLIKLLIASKEVRPEIFPSFNSDLLTNPHLKKIFTGLKEIFLKGEFTDAHSALDQFESPEIRNFLAECAFWEPPGDPFVLAEQCMEKLENLSHRVKIEALKQRIKEAQLRGEDVSEMYKEYTFLKTGRKSGNNPK